MSQNDWNNLAIIVVLLGLISDVIAFFAVIRAQQQGREQQQSTKATKEEIRQLHNELKLLKFQLEQLKE